QRLDLQLLTLDLMLQLRQRPLAPVPFLNHLIPGGTLVAAVAGIVQIGQQPVAGLLQNFDGFQIALQGAAVDPVPVQQALGAGPGRASAPSGRRGVSARRVAPARFWRGYSSCFSGGAVVLASVSSAASMLRPGASSARRRVMPRRRALRSVLRSLVSRWRAMLP